MTNGSNYLNSDNGVLDLVGRLVSVSDFSKGKTAQIFDDIKKNNHEYIILKNNQPTAVLLSIKAYADIVNKARKIETMLERIEESRLLKEAVQVAKGYNPDNADSFHELLAELGISEEEILDLEDRVVIE